MGRHNLRCLNVASFYLIFIFYSARVLFLPMEFIWVVGRHEKVCLGCISEILRCSKLILVRDIGWGCRCARSWCDLDLTLHLAAVISSVKMLSRLYQKS